MYKKRTVIDKKAAFIIVCIVFFSIIISSLTASVIQPKQEQLTEPLSDSATYNISIDFNSIKDTIDLVRATTYNCEISQTDSTPNNTADGSYIDPVKLKRKEIRWVALSWDLIWDEYRQTKYSDTTVWRGPFAFGDTIEIYSKEFPRLNGEWIVHDCMNEQYRNSIDFLTDRSNNKPKLGVGEDVKIIFCIGDRRNKKIKS